MKPSTPADYIATLPDERRAAIQTMHDAIQKVAPKLTPELVSGIIGYGKFHYKYDSGREGDWFIVGLCSRKAHLSLYICSADKNGYLAEQHSKKLGKVKVGKSCIKFKKLEDLNLAAAIAVVKKVEKLGGVGAVM